jgi:hypothetical protein
MPYFPVDDGFHAHPKAGAASLAALGLWVVAGSWCNDQKTDGRIPAHMIPVLTRGEHALADELVAAGLWRKKGTGYRFHEFLADGDGSHRNISRSEIESLRVKKSSGGVIGSHRRWHEARGIIDPDCPYCQGKQHDTPNGSTYKSTYDSPNEVLMPPPHPTPPHKIKPSSSAPPTDDDPDWSAFWAAYPRKVGKGQARRAWPKATKAADRADIITGAKRYAEQRRGQDAQYTAHPATWLNGERWTDQQPPTIDDEGWWNN